MTYKINTQSIFIKITIFIALTIAFALNFKKYVNLDIGLYYEFSIYSSSILFIYLLASKLTSGILEINLNEDNMTINWLKKPLISRHKKSPIHYSDILSWELVKETKYDYFSISLKNGEHIMFFPRLTFLKRKDDLNLFLIKFKKVISKFNDDLDEKLNISRIEEFVREKK